MIHPVSYAYRDRNSVSTALASFIVIQSTTSEMLTLKNFGICYIAEITGYGTVFQSGSLSGCHTEQKTIKGILCDLIYRGCSQIFENLNFVASISSFLEEAYDKLHIS